MVVEVMGGVLIAALLVYLSVAGRAVLRRQVDHPTTPSHSLAELRAEIWLELNKQSAALAEIAEDHHQVRAAVAGGIEHVDRVENRIRSTIKRAKKELEEHGLESPGLDAEARTLSFRDEPGGHEQPVPSLPQNVDQAESSIPGVSAAQLALVRGM